MVTKEIKRSALKELEAAIEEVSAQEIDRLVSRILASQRIFLFGLGRTLLMGRSFVMRLMHLGLQACVVGDTTTPSITAQDLLIVCSGSGQTDISFLIAEKARRLRAAVALVTTNPDSRIAAISDLLLVIPTRAKFDSIESGRSFHPMATVFEQSLLLVFDLMVVELMAGTGQSSADMLKRHANLE